MANTSNFSSIHKDLSVSLISVVSKHYGTDLDMLTGYQICVEAAYQIDKVVARYMADKRESEKNAVKAQIKK